MSTKQELVAALEVAVNMTKNQYQYQRDSLGERRTPLPEWVWSSMELIAKARMEIENGNDD